MTLPAVSGAVEGGELLSRRGAARGGVCRVHKDRRHPILQVARLDPIFHQGGHIAGKRGGGIQLQHPVPVVVQLRPVTVLPHACVDDHNLIDSVGVQVAHLEIGILCPHQFQNLVVMNGIGRQGIELVALLPAYDDLLAGYAVHILVADHIDGGAGALYHGRQLIILVGLPVNADFQLPLVRAHPEKSDGLLHAVSIQILELYLLGQLARQRGGIFPAGVEHFADLVVQLQIVVRRLGLGIHLVH